jgi:general secretion pathway protein D
MKKTAFVLVLFLTALNLWAQTSPLTNAPVKRHLSHRPGFRVNTNVVPDSPSDPNGATILPIPNPSTAPTAMPFGNATSDNGTSGFAAQEEMIPAGNINFQGVDVSQVLEVYAQLVGRTLLRANLPAATIVLKTETPLTKSEAIEALQAVLAMNNISVVNVGDKFVKVLASTDALTAGQKPDNDTAASLPELGSVLTRIVQLKYVKPSEMKDAISPFAKLNSIIPIDSNGILIIRDYAENVKRMLEMVDQVDVNVPAVYISEVIPIKYALVDDIASALNSLGGTGGGGSVSIGNPSASRPTSSGNGFQNNSTSGAQGGGFGGASGASGGYGGNSQRNSTTPGGGAGSSFQQRLQSIISKAAGAQQDQIQIFGQTKIIADERSNSLLIFATRADMDTITNIISKLDVLLSQVLIESVIMEVSLDKTLNTGVSAVQNPSAINSANFKGAGASYNGPSFFSFLTNGTGGISKLSDAGTNLAGGLSYFGEIGNSDYEIAVQAAASDNSINIIQKPRIQTFQAQKASFFVGQTVPYVTGSTYGSAYGNSSSYSQLSVGVELDVTPFINPDGLVVMQIDEEIDDISGSTFIEGVGDVPNTDKRTLNSEVAVKDRDTIILGGAIKSEKQLNKSGVPVLQDIPLLGALFSARSSDKSRDELLVLMRPTVLKTPELAALQARKEEGRLPGIAHLEAQDDKDELKQVQAEEKVEQLEAQKEAKAEARAKKNHSNISTNTPSSALPDGSDGSQTNDVPQ